jgi:hypothetical protein
MRNLQQRSCAVHELHEPPDMERPVKSFAVIDDHFLSAKRKWTAAGAAVVDG